MTLASKLLLAVRTQYTDYTESRADCEISRVHMIRPYATCTYMYNVHVGVSLV